MKKKEPKKNPTIRVKVKCPKCKEKLIISAFRKRTNASVKAEYEVWTEVEVDSQKNLPGMEEEPTGTARAATVKKKKSQRKTTKK